jgi:hypothetical protein
MWRKPVTALGDSPVLVAEPAQHAFVMLGQQTLFLCHLTMFHMEEHMFQLVLRCNLPPDAMHAYVADRLKHPNETYFLGNGPDDLLTVPALHLGQRTSFTADIFRGIPYQPVYSEWPWKHVVPLVANVDLSIEREIYYRHFDFNLKFPDSLTYVIFGAATEAHMTHYQVKEPDFDHVLSLKKAPEWLPEQTLQAGVHLNFPGLDSTPVYCNNPLTEGEHEVQYSGQNYPYRIVTGQTHWFSTKIVNAANPCPDKGPKTSGDVT